MPSTGRTGGIRTVRIWASSRIGETGGSVCVMRMEGWKKKNKMLPQSSMAVLYFNLIDLDLSSCLAVSLSLPPAPQSIFGSCKQERTPLDSLPGSGNQKLGGGEDAGPPISGFFEVWGCLRVIFQVYMNNNEFRRKLRIVLCWWRHRKTWRLSVW